MSARVAIVTGGSRGIGRAVVDRLLADGSRVATCGRGPRPSDLDERALWVSADVSRSEDAQRVVEAATAALGPVTLLVNNAGVQLEKTVLDTTDEDWDLVVGVNCRGVFAMSRAVLPGMTGRRGASDQPGTGGVIVNLSLIHI